MDEIKDIIKQVVGDISSKKPDIQQKIQEVWDSSVDRKILKHTRISGLKNGTLFVSVDSSAWLYQMNIKKRKILEGLQREISDVNNIVFKIGK